MALGLICSACGYAGQAHAQGKFPQPAPEELAMKELPGYPGVSAVVLYSEEITKDSNLSVEHYERIKILTEEGKKLANVEVGYVSSSMFGKFRNDRSKVKDISGRTVHSDGTIVPFSGELYEQTRERFKGASMQSKVFTLPDVQVGSVIEYRYTKQSAGYEVPQWLVQGDLYVQSAHYEWRRASIPVLGSEGKRLTTVSYFPMLPAGTQVVESKNNYSLTVKNVPPLESDDDYLPPLGSYRYRVMFAFTPYKADKYWEAEGKKWSKDVEKFIGPATDIDNQTTAIVAGAKTGEEQLQRIYAEVMKLENTEYTRERDKREDKAEGLNRVNNVADVLAHRRGTPSELTELFVALARGVRLEAYVMLVPDRSEHWFEEGWQEFGQFDDEIAIVKVDGKERFFDPGSRYCQYGHLSWWHTDVEGLRQTPQGTALAMTSDPGAVNSLERTADLKLDATGNVDGTLSLKFIGAPALRWRHTALVGDTDSLHTDLQKYIQALLPKGMETQVTDVQDLDGYEKPLNVRFQVQGKAAVTTGKRMALPVDLFTAQDTAAFPNERREQPVSFSYPMTHVDLLKIAFPKNLTLEGQPVAAAYMRGRNGTYSLALEHNGESFTARRFLSNTDILVPKESYGDLRNFSLEYEAKDRETVVLKASAAAPAM